MSPPLFADLGKPARDVFNKGYNFGFLKADTTTKTGDLEFKTSTAQNINSGKLYGSVDVKYKLPKYGVTLTEKWNTDNTLGTEVVVEDKLLKGLKLSFESAFAPHVGKRSGKVKGEFKHDNITLNTDVSLDSAGGPIFNIGAVAGYEGWLLGYHTGFDPARSKLTHNHVGLGYNRGDYGVHTFLQDNKEFGGNFYHRVNPRCELAANVGWTTGEQTPRFGVATKYQVDRETALRAKISNQSQLGLSVTHELKPGVRIILSSLVSLQTYTEGGHKFGVGLEYEPLCH